MLEVIAGPMFSGKSAELVRRVQLAQIAKLSTVVFRPAIDTRSLEPVVLSRNGSRIIAQCAEYSEFIWLESHAGFDVVGIDEAQFFDDSLPDIARKLIERGIRVIIAGLDLNFAGQPFGTMPILLALAEKVDKLTAVCVRCNSFFASRTQRLINGQPARFDSPQIVIDKFDKYRDYQEGETIYEARCFDCWQAPS